MEQDLRTRQLVRKLIEYYEAESLRGVAMNRALTLNPYDDMGPQLERLQRELASSVHEEYRGVYAALDNPASDWLDALQEHLNRTPIVRGMSKLP